MRSPRRSIPIAVVLTLFIVHPATSQDDGWRTIELETTEVTAPDVAVSPDGEWLVFTLLGHLHRVPTEGGEAEQLTFGPYHDADPAISPDGTRVAFGSNRDGTDSNIFVLNLADGQISQVTEDSLAGRPAWAPDGSAIAYLRLRTRSYHCPSGRAGVARVAVDGGGVEHLSGGDELISSVFYLPDGRLAWATVEFSLRPSTRIDVLIAPDSVETVDTLSGAMGRVLVDARGTGFYARGNPQRASGMLVPEHLVFQGLAVNEERRVATLPMPPCQAAVTPGFAVAPTGDAVYLGEAGGLWKYSVRDSIREPIPFHANVTLEVREPTAPATIAFPTPGDLLTPRGVVSPALTPDGESIVFGAADHLWKQPTVGGPAQRLVDGSGYEREPALSPDGRYLLFISSGAWKQHVQLLDLETREVRTLATGLLYWNPAWSRDGRRVVFRGPEVRWAVAPTVLGGRDMAVLLRATRRPKIPLPHASRRRARTRRVHHVGSPPP
jgi:WD40 repeat protein